MVAEPSALAKSKQKLFLSNLSGKRSLSRNVIVVGLLIEAVSSVLVASVVEAKHVVSSCSDDIVLIVGEFMISSDLASLSSFFAYLFFRGVIT